VTALVVDAGGRRVRTLLQGAASAGAVRIDWDGRDDSGSRAAPGAYFIRVNALGRESTKKVTLLR
jgi:flagellar hook assembly protein FlgD